MRRYQHWIDGEPTRGSISDAFIRTSPAHGGELAAFAKGDANDVDRAARAAALAQRAWADLSGIERAGHLTALADLILKNRDRLAEIEAEEAGKTIRDAKGEIAHSVNLTRYAASLCWEIPGRAQSHHGTGALGLVTYEPRGVVGMITPWNFPMVTLFQKLPYALAAGCTVVIKPSELTSGTTLEMARLAQDAGVPNGVINVVTGSGSVVGAAMIEHPLVDMISFTGSTRAGMEIGSACARLVKRAGLELGGIAANVVFADADIDDALDGALLGTILNAGQECVAGTRILVERKVVQNFTEALAERVKKLRVGIPLDPDADMASVIHEAHMHSVLGHIELARREGATIAVGGGRKSDGAFEKGFFVQPTVLCSVTPSMTYFTEEVFGPVASVTPFDSVDEAIALANDTTYGLGNGLWTKDLDKALQVSKQLKSGTVWVNTYLDGAPQMPFGGYKRSGLGRENGIEGLTEFMDVKSTFIRLGKRTKALAHTAI